MTRARRISELRRRVLISTWGTLLLPGSGQWRTGQRPLALAIAVTTSLAICAALYHLLVGLSLFESALGSFVFGVLLRGIPLLYAFSAIDAYLASLHPDDHAGQRVRRAVFANLLLPGSGYLVARAWLRAGTGLLVLAMILVFAEFRYNRYLDLIYIGMQLVMGFAVYQQLRIAQAQQEVTLPPPPLDPVAPAQVTLVAVVLATVVFGIYVVKLRMAPTDFAQISAEEVRIRPSAAGTEVRVPRLGLSLTAWGEGWIADAHRPGVIFSANHERDVSLRLATQMILPFVRTDRYVESLRRQVVASGYRHERTRALKLGTADAVQLRFSRPLGHGQTLDQWTIALPRGHFAFILLIECNRVRCRELLPDLERTRDSLRVIDRATEAS